MPLPQGDERWGQEMNQCVLAEFNIISPEFTFRLMMLGFGPHPKLRDGYKFGIKRIMYTNSI